MFATYFVSASFEQYDIVVRHYQPTALGRLLGYKPKWTVAQFDGRWGAWYFGGNQSGSTEVEIGNDPIRVSNHHGYLWMEYSLTDGGNVIQSLNNGEYSIFDSLTLLTKGGLSEPILKAIPVTAE